MFKIKNCFFWTAAGLSMLGCQSDYSKSEIDRMALALTEKVTAEQVVIEGGLSEAYEANYQSGVLNAKVGSISRRFYNVVGGNGGSYRSLVNFNDSPALLYEISASRTSFAVYYTLTWKDRSLLVDCFYGNIRNAQNGISIRKAVCNIDLPLESSYADFVYNYSDVWIKEANSISVEALLADQPESLDVLVGYLNDVQVITRYSSIEDLVSATPSTWLIKGESSVDLGREVFYFVYDADGKTPLSLNSESYTAKSLLNSISVTEAAALVSGQLRQHSDN